MTQFHAGNLAFRISDQGDLIGLTDVVSGRSYDAEAHRSPLLRVVIGKHSEEPAYAVYNDKEGKLQLHFDGCRAQVEVEIVMKEKYAAFEVTRIAQEGGHSAIDAVIWGPYAASAAGSIGESVGVVHNGEFAIGLLALNMKTIGGWPAELNKLEFASQPYMDSKFEYEASTAWPIIEGSLLQAYARNRTKGGRRPVWNLTDIEVPPMPGEDAEIIGTRIALFGCSADLVLDTIETIELGEDLPHPMIEGVWGKVSPAANQSYLITDFSEETMTKAVEFTNQAGLKYVYHPDPFAQWGHFVLKPGSFPGGDEGMRACVETAGNEGVKVGIHTLSNFTTLNDPYVTPVPDNRLQCAGISHLSESTDAEAKEISIDDPLPFAASLFRKTARIGTELVEYENVSAGAPWKLLGVKRGANGTAASRHERGLEIGRVWDHPYDVFFPNIELQDEYSLRIAELMRETGLQQISFDGLEGCFAAGHDGYGVNRFVKLCYDGWDKEVINDASIVVPNYLWHIFTRFNWGEPWGVSTREGQLEWRLSNQRYFERNFIPPMLGWFLIRSASDRFEATTQDEIEWVLSKAAGFNAGFALAADMAVLQRNGNIGTLLESVRNWETARRAGAFSLEQRERLREPRSDWHLETLGEGRWNLIPISISKPLDCNPEELQPGQPGGADWSFYNKYPEQPLRFCMRVIPAYGNEDARVKRPTFYTSGVYMTFETEVLAGECLVCDGSRTGKIYDVNWNLLRTVHASAEAPAVRAGGQTISFSCKFEGDPKPSVSVKIYTWGEPELVQVDG
ncbi:hypothetical protein ACFPYJ_14210 [Paenibacillus solisilvae]|uniref:Glycoside hydrolase n=1 Tax=Paenibacillus solisilvae TaxID=2486751 RepID=A0ABW0VWL3_9BACL